MFGYKKLNSIKYHPKVNNLPPRWVVNDRYEIYDNDGCVYDTEKGKDIPLWVFELRDTLIKKEIEK